MLLLLCCPTATLTVASHSELRQPWKRARVCVVNAAAVVQTSPERRARQQSSRLAETLLVRANSFCVGCCSPGLRAEVCESSDNFGV